MARRSKATQLYEGEAGQAKSPPDLKSYLIELNNQMDWLLESIESIEWSGDSILYAEGFTHLERFVLLLEDRRFFRHSGFDWKCVPRVLRQMATFKRLGGVSTIEQQLVRTLLERRERTIRRKTREVLLAWILAHRKPKQSILRVYLATAYFGYKLRGCDEASRLLFGCDADVLSPEQASFLASMLVYPLPKQVRALIDNPCYLGTSTPQDIFDHSRGISPRWTSAMQRRMNYGIALGRKSK